MPEPTKRPENLSLGFAFAIGDIVTHKGFVPTEIRVDGKGEPSHTINRRQRYFVVDRSLVECEAGVQHFYSCRGMWDCDTADRYSGGNRGQALTKDYMKFDEVELISWNKAMEIDERHNLNLADVRKAESEALMREAAKSGAHGSGSTTGATDCGAR